MARIGHVILGRNQLAHEPEMQDTHTGKALNLTRPWELRCFTGSCRRCKDQGMISGCGRNAPTPGGLDKNSVNPVVGVADQPVGH